LDPGSSAYVQRGRKAGRLRNNPTREITRDAKNNIVDLCVKFSALDLRPYNVVKGAGFRDLAQGLIDVGSDFGKVDVNTVLPHPTTIAKKTASVSQRVRDEFLPEVKVAVKEGACAFDSDMWSDKYSKANYLTMEAQYTIPKFELKSQTLFVSQFPPNQKKKKKKKVAGIFRRLMESGLEKMGFALQDVRKNVFTTDQGSNVITGLEDDYYRLNCSSHLTATVLRNVFDFHKKKSKSFLYNNCPACYDIIMACKSIVTYIKRSGKNLELARTVKMMAEPRWNTLLDMLESVCAAFLDIMKLLEDQNESSRLENWDGDIAIQLASFLTLFKNICVEL